MKHCFAFHRLPAVAVRASIGLLFALVSGAHAAPEIRGWESKYVEPGPGAACDNDAGEMAQCAGRKMQHSEKFLRNLIKEVRKLVDKDQVKPFATSNELWFRFRDASCAFDSATSGGSSQAMRYGECVHTYNIRRIHLLEKYRYCLTDGDCPNDLHLYYLIGE